MEKQQSIDVNCTHSLLSCTVEKALKYAEQLSNDSEDGDEKKPS